MEPLRIHTFGGLRIESGKKTVTGFETRKAEALIVYLVCTQRPQLREVLADLLWDERSHHQALSNLRVVLTSLRKKLGPYFTITRQTIAANADTKIWSDVGEFEALLEAVHKAGGISSPQEAERAEQAVNLYRGEFLEGFYIRESRGFEEWLVQERERLHRLAIAALHDLVAYDLQSGAYQSGMDRAARLLALEPFNEAGHRQMMELLAHRGLRNEALAQYESCRRLLWDERSHHQALSNLRVVLTSLRKKLGPYFTITRQTIAANADTKI
ncbi:MAG TPA: BTAD domain-containing putative transcriptional regulator, partial [Candidatus Tectomicrobia bacterium]